VIIFSAGPSTPLMRVSAGAGTPTRLTKIDPAQHTSHRWPVFLPDGKHFLYLAIHHDPSKSANNALYYASLDGRENRPLFHSQSNAVYAGGYLLFARGDQLMAQPFDPAHGTLSGEPRSVAKGVMSDVTTWHLDASVTADGLLAFGSGGSGDLQLIWMDRNGKQVGTVADKIPNLQVGRISPQGDRIALQIDSGVNDIWVLDSARGVRTRLTFGPVANTYPTWSPDGKWIAYMSKRGDHFGLYRKRSDGSGAEEVLVSVDAPIAPDSWSSDGKSLIYTQRTAEGLGQIWVLPLEGDRKPSMVLPRGSTGQLSPDGRWLAYQSSESGTNEVYVVAFGRGQGKWQVSANGGMLPLWGKDGKEFYYLDGNQTLLAVAVRDADGALEFGAPQSIVSRWTVLGQPFYDVTPDGRKILLDRVAQQVSQSITVVTNFATDLKK
jgi:Tol biopolymer transport system component